MSPIKKIEEYRAELSRKLSLQQGSIGLFLEVHNFLLMVVKKSDIIPSGVYLSEFNHNYYSLLRYFTAYGNDPQVTAEIIAQIRSISSLPEFQSFSKSINAEIERLENEISIVIDLLNGADEQLSFPKEFQFPLVEQDENGALTEYGFLESVDVMIQEAPQLRFIIDPSELQMDEVLEKQIIRSWEAAKKIMSVYVKIKTEHRVAIVFDRRLMYFTGESLGVALTFAFAKAILKYYNLPYEIDAVAGTAMTGGVGEDLNLLPVGSISSRIKVRTIFFSQVKVLTLPKSDETDAVKELDRLKEIYPKRKLSLAAAADVQQLMNRRDVVEIKKQSLATRGSKVIKKHYAAFVILFLLLTFSFGYYFYTLDDNPDFFSLDDAHIVIHNSSGSELWRIYTAKITPNMFGIFHKRIVLVADVDSDGVKEVITTGYRETENLNSGNDRNKIYCFNKEREIVWQYSPSDTASTPQEPTEYPYMVRYMDTATVNGKLLGYFIAKAANFPAVLFALDLRTGDRMPGALWHSGHLQHGQIRDYNKDGKRELIANAINNGYECAAFFSIDIDKLSGQAPAPPRYTFYNLSPADFNFYMLVSKTDIHTYYNNRYNVPQNIAFQQPGSFYFGVSEYMINQVQNDLLLYLLNVDYSDSAKTFYDYGIQISERMRMVRDTLVAKGFLDPPYTDTPEYKQMILDGYRYYYEGNWLTKEEWLKVERYWNINRDSLNIYN